MLSSRLKLLLLATASSSYSYTGTVASSRASSLGEVTHMAIELAAVVEGVEHPRPG
jgi:hypothetical protein